MKRNTTREHRRAQPNENDQLASATVKRMASALLGREVGTGVFNQNQDGTGITTIDFTYDDCDPPIGLEVTALHDERERALASQARRFVKELSEYVADRSLGRWTVVLAGHARGKALNQELRQLIAEGVNFTPGYTSDELLQMDRDQVQAFVGRQKKLQLMGLERLIKRGSEPHEVDCLHWSPGTEIVGFYDQLTERVEDKAAALGKVGNRERHLAVVVRDFHASLQPERTECPVLPASIDYLWVIHTWPGRSERAEVWLLPRGKVEWIVSPNLVELA